MMQPHKMLVPHKVLDTPD